MEQIDSEIQRIEKLHEHNEELKQLYKVLHERCETLSSLYKMQATSLKNRNEFTMAVAAIDIHNRNMKQYSSWCKYLQPFTFASVVERDRQMFAALKIRLPDKCKMDAVITMTPEEIVQAVVAE